MDQFKYRTELSETIFHEKYAWDNADTPAMLFRRVVNYVCGTAGGTLHPLMSREDRAQLVQYMVLGKCIPAGRYLRFAGRDYRQYNNCFVLIGRDDTREEWARLKHDVSLLAMTEGGVGVDLSVFRPRGYKLKRTGGVAGGPVCLGSSLNEDIRYARQGNDRRGALWLGLNWQHEDIYEFMHAKDRTDLQKLILDNDPKYPMPLDMTNMSVLWDTDFIQEFEFEGEDPKLNGHVPQLWYDSVEQMCKTGEPGHCYNFWEQENETGRNACTEFISESDSDVCNLGSINLAAIRDLDELRGVVSLMAKFLVCGSIRSELPTEKCRETRESSRKIGLGLMGVHEWLLQRGHPYEVVPELHKWLGVYKDESERAAIEHAERFFISPPTRFRAIAPTGTIGNLIGTSTGIEPIYSTAYKRRYLGTGNQWKLTYNIEPIALELVKEHGIKEEDIETSLSLAQDVEKRIKFQADIQDYIDMGVSSTINLPSWGSEHNNEDTAKEMATTLLRNCHSMRGITVYPDGSIGGQPLQMCSIDEALKHQGSVYADEDAQCKSGVCGS